MQGVPTKDEIIDDPVGWKIWKKRRYIIAIFTFFGYVSSYTLRVNLTVALVAMTSSTPEGKAEFDWDSKLQGLLLSSFFYGYISTQLLGGWLSARIGGKKVFGTGIGVTAVLTLLTPPLIRINVYLLLAVRVIEGIFEGLTIPCAHAIWARWAPPMERSRLCSISYSGNFIGTVFALPICGVLATALGWPSLFYIFGAFGVIWCALWMYFIADNPAEDTRISESELKYLQYWLGKEEVKKNISHPWKAIITSSAVWAIIAAHFSELWGFHTMLTQLPRYMKDVLKFSLSQIGYISAIPYLIIAIILPLSGHIADYVQSKKLLDLTKIRKVTTCSSFLIQTVFIIITGFVESPAIAVLCLSISIGIGGFAVSGFGINHLDIAPQHASVLMGISNTFATIPGMLSPLICGYIVQNGTPAEWRIIFITTGCVYLAGALVYGIFASGERQKWAEQQKSDDLRAYSNPALDVDSHI